MLYTIRLPHGKHRGRDLADVPLSYLRWMLAESAGEPRLLTAVRAEVARRGERFLPAGAVLLDLQETLEATVADDLLIPHMMAGRLTDHVLETFETVRQRHGIGTETELCVPARRNEAVFNQRGSA